MCSQGVVNGNREVYEGAISRRFHRCWFSGLRWCIEFPLAPPGVHQAVVLRLPTLWSVEQEQADSFSKAEPIQVVGKGLGERSAGQREAKQFALNEAVVASLQDNGPNIRPVAVRQIYRKDCHEPPWTVYSMWPDLPQNGSQSNDFGAQAQLACWRPGEWRPQITHSTSSWHFLRPTHFEKAPVRNSKACRRTMIAKPHDGCNLL